MDKLSSLKELAGVIRRLSWSDLEAFVSSVDERRRQNADYDVMPSSRNELGAQDVISWVQYILDEEQ